MPLAVTHVLSSIILVDLYRDYISKHKRYFTMHTLLWAGIGGILPDIDMVLHMAAKLAGFTPHPLLAHGGITHTPLFGLLFLIPGIILWHNGKHKKATYFFVITFGIFLHIFLDYLIGGGGHGGIMFLWPFSSQGWKIHLVSRIGLANLPAALDAIILLAWLWHEEAKHKISDFF